MNALKTEPGKLNTDLIGGILMLAIAAFFHYNMDPDFTRLAAYFPERLIIVLTVLGVILLIKARVRPVMMNSFVGKMNASMVFTLIVGLAWVFLLEWTGFILSSVTAIFIILLRLEPASKRTPVRVVKLALLAALEVAVIYVVFVRLLYVTMPVGRLFG
jgi:hypothetical protein